ncbi:hypothetical protein HDU85_004618 [Gaertneriomyces sp. JEL0708]|nr:hypothetical protein HDU85_004618 [Gaertneriomyces sp. JEL0708]
MAMPSLIQKESAPLSPTTTAAEDSATNTMQGLNPFPTVSKPLPITGTTGSPFATLAERHAKNYAPVDTVDSHHQTAIWSAPPSPRWLPSGLAGSPLSSMFGTTPTMSTSPRFPLATAASPLRTSLMSNAAAFGEHARKPSGDGQRNIPCCGEVHASFDQFLKHYEHSHVNGRKIMVSRLTQQHEESKSAAGGGMASAVQWQVPGATATGAVHDQQDPIPTAIAACARGGLFPAGTGNADADISALLANEPESGGTAQILAKRNLSYANFSLGSYATLELKRLREEVRLSGVDFSDILEAHDNQETHNEMANEVLENVGLPIPRKENDTDTSPNAQARPIAVPAERTTHPQPIPQPAAMAIPIQVQPTLIHGTANPQPMVMPALVPRPIAQPARMHSHPHLGHGLVRPAQPVHCISDGAPAHASEDPLMDYIVSTFQASSLNTPTMVPVRNEVSNPLPPLTLDTPSVPTAASSTLSSTRTNPDQNKTQAAHEQPTVLKEENVTTPKTEMGKANSEAAVNVDGEETPTPRKPHPCPIPGCLKSYKNPNGLKYHLQHGHPEFPRPEGAENKTKEHDKNAPKPYPCTMYGCNKQYKNVNGLKYHLVHAHQFSEAECKTMLKGIRHHSTSRASSTCSISTAGHGPDHMTNNPSDDSQSQGAVPREVFTPNMTPESFAYDVHHTYSPSMETSSPLAYSEYQEYRHEYEYVDPPHQMGMEGVAELDVNGMLAQLLKGMDGGEGVAEATVRGYV